MHEFYETKMEELTQWDSTLKCNFPRTAFAAALFNLGPKTECYPHRDWANVSWGQCAVTVLGEYDADQGGHLVCWDLGLVIRFPLAQQYSSHLHLSAIQTPQLHCMNIGIPLHSTRLVGYSGGLDKALSLDPRRA
jgi:hypothetical protein